jgi:hypothetical protein
MKAKVDSAKLLAPADQLAKLRLLAGDLRAVGRIGHIEFVEGSELDLTDINLAEIEED